MTENIEVDGETYWRLRCELAERERMELVVKIEDLQRDHPGCAYMLGRADAEAEVSEWIARYVADAANKPVEERTSDEQE